MDGFVKKVTQLFEVRKLTMLILVATFVTMTLRGHVAMEAFINVLLLAMGYYFGRYVKNPDDNK
jgi:hypothetical protein